MIYEVGRRVSVPLQPVEKRRLVGNFMHDLLYSHPGRDTLNPGCYTMRQVATCAVCAGKGWLENVYPCYLFKEYSASSTHGEAHDEENVAEQDDEENAGEEELAANRDIVIRDNDIFCLPGRMHVMSAIMPLLCDRVTGLKGYRTQGLRGKATSLGV